MSVSRSEPRSSCGRSRNCNRGDCVHDQSILLQLLKDKIMRTFRGGLLIGLAVAVAVPAAAIPYERYDTPTLKRTNQRGEGLCGIKASPPGFSVPDDTAKRPGLHVDPCPP